MSISKPILTALLLGLTACAGTFGDPSDIKQTQVVRLANDEVKLISAEIRQSRSSESLQSPSYSIHRSSRLLMRQSNLKKSQWQILDQQALLMKIEFPTQEMAELARGRLQICPLEKNWMMLATWAKAHPYRDGSWSQPGGDFNLSACLSALPSNHALLSANEEASFCGTSPSAPVLCFDLKPWFTSYVRERQMDFGVVLINESAEPLMIMGDASLHGPALFWRKLR